MEQQKNSRNTRPAGSRQNQATRMPSGFSGAGQPPRRKTAAAPAQAPAPEKKKEKKLRTKREKPVREPGQNKKTLLRVLAAALIALLLGLILLIVFGDRGTYHQMPTITVEEAQPSFEPEKTPLPGVQEAI